MAETLKPQWWPALGWLPSIAQEVGQLLHDCRSPNWDSYEAKAARPELAFSGLLLLSLLVDEKTPRPNVAPTNTGGIQIEWHVSDMDLELEVTDLGTLYVSYDRGDENMDYSLAGVAQDWTADARLRSYIKALEAER